MFMPFMMFCVFPSVATQALGRGELLITIKGVVLDEG
jgi:hypothetical protein